MSDFTTRRRFARALIIAAGIDAQPRPTAVNVVVAWMFAESGRAVNDGKSGAAFNPLNTTKVTDGSTMEEWNKVHVQNYISLLDGFAATVSTLSQDNMADIRKALGKEGLSGDETARAIDNSLWGTGNLEAFMATYRKHATEFDALPIGVL